MVIVTKVGNEDKKILKDNRNNHNHDNVKNYTLKCMACLVLEHAQELLASKCNS